MGLCKSKAAAAVFSPDDYFYYDELSEEKQHQVRDKYLVLFANHTMQHEKNNDTPLNLLITNGEYHMTGYIFGSEQADCCTTVLTPLDVIVYMFETFIYRSELYTVQRTTSEHMRYKYKGKKYVVTGLLTITDNKQNKQKKDNKEKKKN
jgi:hypothetical protein